jgi:hypothetical protein
MREVRIALPAGEVGASIHGEGETALVLGHGAGGDRRAPFLVRMAEALAGGGRAVVLYNFPYTEQRRRRPDPGPALEAAADGVARYVRDALRPRRLVLGGKSMGGRIASQAVARGTAADGLVFLGYPLHPPGKPDQRREAHLPGIAAPMLFVQGTRDAFARWDLIEAAVARLGDAAAILRIEGGDHSFAVPAKAGRSAAQVEHEIAAGVSAWLAQRRL